MPPNEVIALYRIDDKWHASYFWLDPETGMKRFGYLRDAGDTYIEAYEAASKDEPWLREAVRPSFDPLLEDLV